MTPGQPLVYAPAFARSAELAEHLARGSFYFSHRPDIELHVATNLPLPASLDAPHLDAATPSMYEGRRPHIRVHDPGDAEALDRLCEAGGAILQWSAELDAAWSARIARARAAGSPVWQVDHQRIRHAGSFYVRAGAARRTDAVQLERRSRKRFLDLLPGARAGIAYLIGTGPSVSTHGQFDFADGVGIVCNTAILDENLMDHVRPRFLTFADPIFHLGCSRYAAAFRSAVTDAARRWDLHVLVPLHQLPLLQSLIPEVRDRCIGVPFHDEGVNLDLRRRFSVLGVDNILTLLMLPLASTLAGEVRLLGFDGRAPEGETYFWKHNAGTQFTDLLDNVRQSHPAFFDLSFEDYHAAHASNVGRFIEAGESAGITYRTLTPSFVPALRRRGAPPAETSFRNALTEGRAFRLVSINPDLEGPGGHWLGQDLRLRDAALAAGGDYACLAGRAVIDTRLAHSALPLFTSYSWDIKRPQALWSQRFVRDFSLALTRIREADPETPNVYVFASGAWPHLLAMARAIAESGKAGDAYLLNLGRLPDRFPRLIATLSHAEALRSGLGLHAFADTAEGAREIAARGGGDLPVFPFFNTTSLETEHIALANAEAARRDAAAPSRLRVYYASNTRTDKGYDLVAQLAASLSPEERQLFEIVAREWSTTPRDEAVSEAARILGREARSIAGVLSEEEYVRRLIESDILLVPYRVSEFACRTSGVLADAIALGRPVVATRGTWAGNHVERLGVGATFRDGDAADLRRALFEVRARWTGIRLRSVAAQATWRSQHEPGRLIEIATGLLRSAPRSLLSPAAVEGIAESVERRFAVRALKLADSLSARLSAWPVRVHQATMAQPMVHRFLRRGYRTGRGVARRLLGMRVR